LLGCLICCLVFDPSDSCGVSRFCIAIYFDFPLGCFIEVDAGCGFFFLLVFSCYLWLLVSSFLSFFCFFLLIFIFLLGYGGEEFR